MISKFRKGESTFVCSVCGRTTRDTGVQSLGAKICPQDYELAGLFNSYQDGDEDGIRNCAALIRRWCSEIVARGGTLDSDARTLLAVVGADH